MPDLTVRGSAFRAASPAHSSPSKKALKGKILSSVYVCGSARKPAAAYISHTFAKCIDTTAHFNDCVASMEGDMRDRRQKFVDLAEARVNKTLKDIQLVGNLSNRAAYEFTDADVRKVFGALQKALDSAKSRFNREGDSAGGEFKL